ncbi:YqaJ viral recombinase family protein (plasmid) [Ectopseudomonas mendocina]
MSYIKSILASLEQAPVVQQEHAERWLGGVMKYHREQAEWHAKRLKGIGGSEMGAVMRGLYGVKESGFGTLQRVVQQKLMMRLPEFQTVHMKRGTVLEPLARLAFMYRYRGIQDQAAMDATATAPKRPGYEWLVGNPDDIIQLNGKRYTTDYKVPNSFSDEIEYDYRVQLHHYALLSRMAGVKIDGLILAKLDLSAELAQSLVDRVPSMSGAQLHDVAKTIARMDMPGMRVVGLGVDMERSMQVDILDAGATAWNDYVIQGVVPPKPAEQLIELDDQRMLQVGALQQQYAMAKAGINYLSQQVTDIESSLNDTLKGVDTAGKSLPLSLVKIAPPRVKSEVLVQEARALGALPADLSSGEPTYSVTALLEEIKRLKGDPDAAHLKADPEPESGKAKAYLQKLGVDLEALATGNFGLRLSTAKADKEIGGVFERSAAEKFGSWLDENSLAAALDDDDQLEAIDEDFDLEVVSGPLHEVFAAAESGEPNQTPSTPKYTSASMR